MGCGLQLFEEEKEEEEEEEEEEGSMIGERQGGRAEQPGMAPRMCGQTCQQKYVEGRGVQGSARG